MEKQKSFAKDASYKQYVTLQDLKQIGRKVAHVMCQST